MQVRYDGAAFVIKSATTANANIFSELLRQKSRSWPMKTVHVKTIPGLYRKSELFRKVQPRYNYTETVFLTSMHVLSRTVSGFSSESNKRATKAYC